MNFTVFYSLFLLFVGAADSNLRETQCLYNEKFCARKLEAERQRLWKRFVGCLNAFIVLITVAVLTAKDVLT